MLTFGGLEGWIWKNRDVREIAYVPNEHPSKYVKLAFQDCDTNLEDHGWIVRVLRSKFSCAHRSPICGWGQVARTGDILPVKKDGYAQQFRPAENFSGFKGQTPFNHWGQNEVPNQFWGQLRARKVCPRAKDPGVFALEIAISQCENSTLLALDQPENWHGITPSVGPSNWLVWNIFGRPTQHHTLRSISRTEKPGHLFRLIQKKLSTVYLSDGHTLFRVGAEASE